MTSRRRSHANNIDTDDQSLLDVSDTAQDARCLVPVERGPSEPGPARDALLFVVEAVDALELGHAVLQHNHDRDPMYVGAKVVGVLGRQMALYCMDLPNQEAQQVQLAHYRGYLGRGVDLSLLEVKASLARLDAHLEQVQDGDGSSEGR